MFGVARALDLIAVTAFLALLCASRTIDTAIIRHLQHMHSYEKTARWALDEGNFSHYFSVLVKI